MTEELRSLVDEGVPITRDTIEKAVEQIALSCCRGPVQVATVLELIESGKIERHFVSVPVGPTRQALAIGSHALAGSSWRNLQKRMVSAGFRFKVVRPKVRGRFADGHVVAYWTGGAS